MDYYDDDEYEGGGRKKGVKMSAAERKKRGYGSKTSKKTVPKKRAQSLALPKTLTKSELRMLLKHLLAEMKARGL